MGRLAIVSGLFALALATPAVAQTEIAYGAAPLQKLDIYAAKGVSGPAPLVVFVHGGSWSKGDKGNATGAAKIAHFTARGFAVASVNYRLVPDARAEDQAQDVADALGYLVKHAGALRVDASRIALMGHSAGAQIAALVGTDPQYLKRAGLGLDRIDGVILLDGAAYDIPVQRRDGPPLMQPVYSEVFGDEPGRQRALSATLQAAAPNAPAFLLLHIDRDDARRQSNALGAALRTAGTKAEVRELPGQGMAGHMEINRAMGEADYPGTAVVDAWMDVVFKP